MSQKVDNFCFKQSMEYLHYYFGSQKRKSIFDQKLMTTFYLALFNESVWSSQYPLSLKKILHHFFCGKKKKLIFCSPLGLWPYLLLLCAL